MWVSSIQNTKCVNFYYIHVHYIMRGGGGTREEPFGDLYSSKLFASSCLSFCSLAVNVVCG